MKKFLLAVLACALVIVSASVVLADNAPFHIGIMTGSASQSEDELRGAEHMIELYGDSAKGGMITHVTYPDNFMAEQEAMIAQIVALADDPLMKVIVVHQGVPGTSAGLKKVREARPDIILLIGHGNESPAVTSPAADVVTMADNISRGYLIPHTAKELGANTFVHISFPRHMNYEPLNRSREIMKEACADLGLKFYAEIVPDPLDIGVEAAQQFIMDNMPKWVEKYGKETEFYCTNDALTEPLLRSVAELGAIFVEAALPSPLMGYPGAFDLDFSAEKGDWPAILQKLENTIAAAGGGGSMGTWAWSYGFTTSAALVEFGKRIVEGSAKLDSMDDLLACFNEFTPGAKWNAGRWIEPDGTVTQNVIRMYQDTYILDRGPMHTTEVEVPEKYLKIEADFN